jgi:O-antigen/teichoic acid export membrane protein
MALPLDQLRDRLRSVREVARLRPFDTSTPEGRSRERYRRILLSSATGLLTMAVAALVGLASVPISLAYLGKEAYGLWAVVGSVAAWIALFDLGLVQGLVIAVSEAHGREDREAARAYFSTAFFALGGVALIVVAAVAMAAPLLPWSRFFEVPASIPPGSAAAGFGVALALTALALPVALVPQAYAGFQRAYVASVFTMAGALLSLGFLVLATRLGAPFAAVVGASGAAALVAGLASLAWLAGRQMPWMRPKWSAVSAGALRRLLVSAVPLYVFQLGSLLVNQSQRPVLAHRAGLEIVAEYDVLIRVYVFASMVVMASTASVAPAFRESWERGERDWVRRTFWRLVSIRVVAALLGCTILVLAGNDLLRLWLGRPDFRFDISVWLALSAYVVAALWGSAFFELLTILDRIWIQVAVVLVQGVLTVALTWALGGRYGVLGALAAVGVPTLVVSGWVMPSLGIALLRRDR